MNDQSIIASAQARLQAASADLVASERLLSLLQEPSVVPPPQAPPPKRRDSRPIGLKIPEEAGTPREVYRVTETGYEHIPSGKKVSVGDGRQLRYALTEMVETGQYGTVTVQGHRFEGINQYRINPGVKPTPIRDEPDLSQTICVKGVNREGSPIIEGFAFHEIGGQAEFHLRNIEVQPDAYQVGGKWEVAQIGIGTTITGDFGTLRLFDVNFAKNPNCHYKIQGLACKWWLRRGRGGMDMRRIKIYDPAQEWFDYYEDPYFVIGDAVQDLTPASELDFGRGFVQQTSRKLMGWPDSRQGIIYRDSFSAGTNILAGGGGAWTFCYGADVHLIRCRTTGGPVDGKNNDGAALVVWEMGGDGGPYVRPDGYTTGNVILDDCDFSMVESKRSLCEISGARGISIDNIKLHGSKPWIDMPRPGGPRSGRLWLSGETDSLAARVDGTPLGADDMLKARGREGLWIGGEVQY